MPKPALATLLQRTDLEHFQTVLRPELIRLQIEREISRSDRTGERFCLLLMQEVSEAELKASPSLLEDIARTLLARLRKTDDVGFVSTRQLAAILPVTGYEGGCAVARELEHLAAKHGSDNRFEVFTYPTNWLMDASCEGSGRDYVVELSAEDGGEPKGDDHNVHSLELLLTKKPPIWKRLLDIFGAGVGLVALSPLFLLIATLVRSTSQGPVFYSQERSGLAGKTFRIYKFRSMVSDADRKKLELLAMNEQDGPAFKIKKDPRVTPIGRILRTLSLDELPQLWNVLKGDMSLVGPRPLPVAESLDCKPWQRHRLAVKPGLTCIWQLEGRSSVSFPEWMRMDLRYSKKESLLEDLKLIFRTIGSVVFKRNGC